MVSRSAPAPGTGMQWLCTCLVCKSMSCTLDIISLSHHAFSMALPLGNRALAVPCRGFHTPILGAAVILDVLSRKNACTQAETPHSEFDTHYAHLQSQKLYETHVPTTPFQKAILVCGSAFGSFVAPERDSESTDTMLLLLLLFGIEWGGGGGGGVGHHPPFPYISIISKPIHSWKQDVRQLVSP